jgi:type I restriction enzyme R subunit
MSIPPRSISFDSAGYLDPRAEIDNTPRNLPHWRQPGVTYFVTFHLADSLPQEKLISLQKDRQQFLLEHPEPWSEETRHAWNQTFSQRIHDWLDAGYGAYLLKDPIAGQIVASAMKHFDKDRYDLLAYVVMPNHVHALLTPQNGHTLDQILHSWKSFSATEINKTLHHQGPVWQKETYDHIVRNPQALWSIANYIVKNPSKVGIEMPFVESHVPNT